MLPAVNVLPANIYDTNSINSHGKAGFQGRGEEGGGCPERPETPTRLQGSLLGEVGALLLPCSRLAETKPRLAQPQEEGSLGAQAGPERRLSGSFLSQGLRGTVTW